MLFRLPLLLLGLVYAGWADTTLVPLGSIWKYLDNGTDPGTAWRGTAFNDSGWLSGPAQLGYGDGDESTVVSGGPNPDNHYITTYFRRSFVVTNPNDFGKLLLRILRDDGAVVYLNGVEIHCGNMPPGAVTFQTLAANSVTGTDESLFFAATLAAPNLIAGTNVAVTEPARHKIAPPLICGYRNSLLSFPR